MCAIAGLLGDFDNRDVNLNIILDSMYHRGPDDCSIFEDREYIGGMRRLSINDIDGGSQPLFNHDKSVVVFYNGEIYNSNELRKKLGLKGKIFNTDTDGEVIAHLYEDLGEAVFEQLDGMFAIAIWDKNNKKLVLARDIPGEKPLYYINANRKFAFASEIKAIEKIPSFSLTLNLQSIWDYPTFLWIPEPSTIYNEVGALPRGHYMVVKDGATVIKSFPNLFDKSCNIVSSDDAIIQTRAVVEDAVVSRLLSDVPVGSFLSGGLDSSIVATVAASNLNSLDTFTIAFEDVDDPYHGTANESEAAAKTAAFIGSNHHTIHVTSDTFRNSLDDFCKYSDQPFSVSSGLGVMAIAREARAQGIKVLLSGDGADETFGGYSWYKYLNEMKQSHNKVLNNIISFQNVGLSIEKRLNTIAHMKPSNRALALHYYAHEIEKDKLFNQEWTYGLLNSNRYFEKLDYSCEPEDYIRHDRNFYFPFEMLRKVDRMTMAFSVEGRVPFAAPSVLGLSEKLKFNHMIHGDQLKWVLRKAFEDILPIEVINRPKHGFNVPIDRWLVGDWSSMVDEAFSEGSMLHKYGLLSHNAMDEAHILLNNKERLSGHTVFSFIMLNKWLNR
jgi:asparagine synthase (glutamine-hydrolysing)